MPRDMTGTGRFPPQPRFQPYSFYSCVRLGDSEQLKKIMDTDPYFWSQDNGAGAPLHFATTYKQLDMVHHIIRSCRETLNQRDERGLTALHRAAFLAQYEGYLEIYEYLLSEGADPSILSDDFDPYLQPGRHAPIDLAVDSPEIRNRIRLLEAKYKDVPKVPEPHEDFGDWWALYDYGPDTVKTWPKGYKHPYPEVKWREREAAAYRKEKEARRARRAGGAGQPAAAGGAITAAPVAPPSASSPPAPPLSGPVAFLFPGQGSQAVGMLAASKDLPAVQAMLATANKVLGYDILQEKLDDTVHAQPALFIAGLAAVEKLRSEGPAGAAAVASASACAGLSLGEYCALVFAGALPFEDALRVVKARAEAMAAVAQAGPHGRHGMLSVVGLEDAKLEALCSAARAAGPPGTVCAVANYLFPQGRVVSGDKAALEEVLRGATAAGALKAQLVAVSGAFHTSRMDAAAAALKAATAGAAFSQPRIPVYSNVTGEPFPVPPGGGAAAAAAAIAPLLARQLTEPVRWEGTLGALLKAGKTELYELGVGAQVKAMVKRVDNAAWKAMKTVAA